MLHFVTSYMKQNKSRKQTLESAQYGLEIIFNHSETDCGTSFLPEDAQHIILTVEHSFEGSKKGQN